MGNLLSTHIQYVEFTEVRTIYATGVIVLQLPSLSCPQSRQLKVVRKLAFRTDEAAKHCT